MTAREHAERAVTLLAPGPSSEKANANRSMAHALTAIALVLTAPPDDGMDAAPRPRRRPPRPSAGSKP